jgi:predicted nucleic acid-binding Zn ribbon protein
MKRLALLIIAALMGMMLMNGVASAETTDVQPEVAQTQQADPKPADIVTVNTEITNVNCNSKKVTEKVTTTTVSFHQEIWWTDFRYHWVKDAPVVKTKTNVRDATVAECPPPVPTQPKDEVKVVVSDPLVQCDQGTALVRTFTTTTPYVLVDNKWVLGTPVQTYTDSVTNATLAQCPKPADIVTSVTSDPFVECDKGTVLVRTFITTTSFELNDKNVFVKGTPVETYTDVYTDATAQQCPPVVVDPPADPDCTGIGFFDPEIGKCVATDPETSWFLRFLLL